MIGVAVCRCTTGAFTVCSRAAIVTAEGFREKVKTEAEGSAQASIAMATADQQVTKLKAKGNADARRLIAKAEADAVTIIADALQVGIAEDVLRTR